MHARRRGQLTAFNRSNSMRMVGGGHVPFSSRISSEESFRGHHEMYGSEYRNYNYDGFGHVQPKHFLRRSDLFMEAGRMAAEYLVRKGVLPPSVLYGKGQNGNFRSNYNSGFRAHEGGDLQPQPVGTRPSALSRLGNHVPDVVPTRKRYSDDYGPVGPYKSQFRARRRKGFYNDSDWNHEVGRSGSYSKRPRASSPDTDDRRPDDKKIAKECSTKKNSETGSGANTVYDSEQSSEKHSSKGDKATKESSNSSGKDDLPPKEEAEDVKMSANMETSASEVGEAKNGNDNDDKDSRVELHTEEGIKTNMKGSDLLSLCRFESVPRRTRSSLTARRSKPIICDAVAEEEEKEAGEIGELEEFEKIPLDVSVDQNRDNKSQDCENPSLTQSEERNAAAIHPVKEECMSSFSPADDTVMKAHVKTEALEGENENGYEQDQNMKPLELTSPDDVRSDCFYFHSGLEEKEKLQNLHEPKGNAMQSDDFEEKLLFPGTFKTCDLNLMEATDLNDNHDIDADPIFPSVLETRKESAPIGIDLSINNSCGLQDKYSNCGFGGKYVEVIDLENDSEQVGSKRFNNQLGSSINELPRCDGFANNDTNNVNEMVDVHDSYGLMLSELLGNDIPSCSSVPGEDMSVLNNDMVLHNGEGLLGVDESIYMSLGEIPLSFPWEQQPPQEYRRPF